MTSVAEAAAAAMAKRTPKQPEKVRGRSKDFYASVAWKRLRYRILAENAGRNGGLARCELCSATAVSSGGPLNVDHIDPLSKCWERRLDPTNLQVLCGPCNHGKLNGPAQDFRPPDR